MSKRSELYKTALDQERHMLCHFRALSELLDEVNPITRQDFAKMFPRTYNAVVTDDPYSFDLPDKP